MVVGGGIAAWAAAVFIVACWVADLRTRHIPNWLSGAAMLGGLIGQSLALGGLGFGVAVAGIVLAGGCLILPFLAGGVGGGDVKMMAAIGAILGPTLALRGLIVGLILGGVIMLVHLVRIGRLREKLASTLAMLRKSTTQGSTSPLQLDDQAADAVTLPYSIPLGLGTFWVLWGPAMGVTQ